jgi:hypothetical protein
MKTKARPWNAEEHRRYAETWLAGLAQLAAVSGKPLHTITLMVAIVTGQPTKMLQLLASLW